MDHWGSRVERSELFHVFSSNKEMQPGVERTLLIGSRTVKMAAILGNFVFPQRTNSNAHAYTMYVRVG